MVDYSKWDKLDVSDDESNENSPRGKAELTDGDSCSSGSGNVDTDPDESDAEEGGENDEDDSEGSWETDEEEGQSSQAQKNVDRGLAEAGPSNAAPG